MPKSISELPEKRAEFGKAYLGNKEKPIEDEPKVEVSLEQIYGPRFRKAEKPSGMARLFGSAQGLSRKIGDYFVGAKKWAEQVFVRKELEKGKTKENIIESIDQNEDPIDLTAFREVLEGTKEAVDQDVADSKGRNEGGLENLEAKAVEAKMEEDIVKETFKLLEGLEKEAEEAQKEFKEEVAEEKEEEFSEEEHEKITKDLEYKKRVLKDTQKYVKPSAVSAKKVKGLTEEIIKLEKKKKSEENKPTWEDVDVKEFDEEAQIEELNKKLELRKKVLRDTEKYARQTSAAFKKVAQLTEEILSLEKEKIRLTKSSAGKKEDFSDEEKEWFKKGEDMAEEKKESDVEKEDWKDEEKEFFKKGEKWSKKREKSESKEDAEMPFGKKSIDEDHEKYLEIKEYEEEHGEAPKGDSAELHLSFSFDDYKKALDKDPKKAKKMEEEMYEKLTTYTPAKPGKGRETVGIGPVVRHRTLSRK
jgi:hypothetical protein